MTFNTYEEYNITWGSQPTDWKLMVICSQKTELIETSERHGWPLVMEVYPSRVRTLCCEREWQKGEQRQRIPLTHLLLQKHGDGQARLWALKGNCTSLCVPMCSCVEWPVKDLDAESQLCPLSWDCGEAQRNSSSGLVTLAIHSHNGIIGWTRVSPLTDE